MNDYAVTYWTAKVRQKWEPVLRFAYKEHVYRMMNLDLGPAFHIQARHAAKELDGAMYRLKKAGEE